MEGWCEGSGGGVVSMGKCKEGDTGWYKLFTVGIWGPSEDILW